MHATLLATLLTIPLALRTAAQTFPACASSCLLEGITASGCAVTDYYCQCTTGSQVFEQAAIPCLCHNSTCTTTDLLTLLQETNQICSSALSASHQTYTATTIGLQACASASSAATTTAAASAATTTSAHSGSSSTAQMTTGSGSATQSAAMQTTTGSSGAAARLVFGEAVLGLAGVAAFAL